MPEDHIQPGTLQRSAEAPDEAWRDLLTSLYADLRMLARHYLGHERPDHTLQATALVHEAYLRLLRRQVTTWQDRSGLFAACAQAMRRILVDHERARRRVKRGGTRQRISLDGAGPAETGWTFDLLALDTALERLAAIDPVRASIVELRFFGGLTASQIARHLGLSEPTVNRYWRLARAWLYRELAADE